MKPAALVSGHEYVVGPVRSRRQTPARSAVGVGRVLSHDPGHHGRDEHRRHETGHDQYRAKSSARGSAASPVPRGAVQPGFIAGGDRNRGEKIVLTVIPSIFGIALLNGTIVAGAHTTSRWWPNTTPAGKNNAVAVFQSGCATSAAPMGIPTLSSVHRRPAGRRTA